MPRLLLITAAFPPSNGGPADQMSKRVKYLARAGWQVDVLTPAIPATTPINPDPAPTPDGVAVHRTNFLLQSSKPSLRHDQNRPRSARRLRGLTDLLFVPGGYSRWLPSAVRAGRRLARNADVILSVSNPISTHLVAAAVARSSKLPWIAELRDPIVGYSYSRRGPEALNRRLEAWIVRRARKVVQWGDFVPAPISNRYPRVTHKFHLIPHTGFDADDFVGYRRAAPTDGPLRVCYTGSFYGDSITPVAFLQALASYLTNKNALPVQALFAGDWHADYDRLSSELGLEPHVQPLGRLSRAACVELWQHSHVVLLILSDSGDDVDRIPSKFWDYVASGATILALVAADGRLAELIRTQSLGVAVPPCDVEAIERAISTLAREHRAGRLGTQPSTEFLESATKATSEAALSNLLLEVIEGGAPSASPAASNDS